MGRRVCIVFVDGVLYLVNKKHTANNKEKTNLDWLTSP